MAIAPPKITPVQIFWQKNEKKEKRQNPNNPTRKKNSKQDRANTTTPSPPPDPPRGAASLIGRDVSAGDVSCHCSDGSSQMEREFCSPVAPAWPPAHAHAGAAARARLLSPSRRDRGRSRCAEGPGAPSPHGKPLPHCPPGRMLSPTRFLLGTEVLLLPMTAISLSRLGLRSRCDAGGAGGGRGHVLRQQRCSGVGQLILDTPLSNSRSYIGCLYIGLPMKLSEGNSEHWNETPEVRRR